MEKTQQNVIKNQKRRKTTKSLYFIQMYQWQIKYPLFKLNITMPPLVNFIESKWQKIAKCPKIQHYIVQSGIKYFLLSTSCSGSIILSYFFFFSTLTTDLAMMGLPFLFSLSTEDSIFCFRLFSASISSSFFYFFLSLLRARHSFSSYLIRFYFSSLPVLSQSNCLSMLSSISLRSSRQLRCFWLAGTNSISLAILMISDYSSVQQVEIQSLLVVFRSYSMSLSTCSIWSVTSFILAMSSVFFLFIVYFLLWQIFLAYQIYCSIYLRFVIRVKFDSSSEWKTSINWSGCLKNIYPSYSESSSYSAVFMALKFWVCCYYFYICYSIF